MIQLTQIITNLKPETEQKIFDMQEKYDLECEEYEREWEKASNMGYEKPVKPLKPSMILADEDYDMYETPLYLYPEDIRELAENEYGNLQLHTPINSYIVKEKAKDIIKLIKALFVALFFFIPVFSQTMYSWSGNPGWISSNSSGNTLSWQPSISTVSTSGFNTGTSSWNTYNNSQITTYTSPSYDFTGCSTSAYVNVSIGVNCNLESRFDWMYFQYSTNNGTTWSNPVALSTYTNGSGINLSAYAPLTNYVNTNSNRNGWTNSFTSTFNYVIPKTVNKFRFIFESDGSVNSYFTAGTTYIYYCDITSFAVTCINALGEEVVSFSGEGHENSNTLNWETMNEDNIQKFVVEKSIDGKEWSFIGEFDKKGNGKYFISDSQIERTINYYRLKIREGEYYDKMVSIDNRTENIIESKTNLLGQQVGEDYEGITIIRYKDGRTEKRN